MVKVWIFNPGHEEALRIPVHQRYTPKREVIQMMYSLASLLTSFADEDDLIWQPNPSGTDGQLLTISLTPITPEQQPSVIELSPWALEPHYLRSVADSIGKRYPGIHIIVPTPSTEYLELSHRRSAHALLSHLIIEGLADPNLLPEWVESKSGISEIRETIQSIISRLNPTQSNNQAIFVKRPFTSSGRGVQRIDLPISSVRLESLVSSCIKSGSLSIEPFLQVIDNWALEYWSDGNGEVNFVALSHFETLAQAGAYTGNILAPQTELWSELTALIGKEHLEQIIALHVAWLRQTLACSYRGYIGIDLLLYHDSGSNITRLHPAVEINLRTTMGVLAHQVYDRLISPEARGYYRLVYLSSTQDKSYYEALRVQSPPCYTSEGLIRSGHYPLTPLRADASFYAYLDLK